MFTVRCVILSIFTIITTVNSKCNYHTSIDISSGSKLANGSVKYDGHIFGPDLQLVHVDTDNRTTLRGCICELKTCMGKCCPLGQAFVNKTCQATNDPIVNPLNITVYNNFDEVKGFDFISHFAPVPGWNCKDHYFLFLHDGVGDKFDGNYFFLQTNGEILVPAEENFVDQYYDVEKYCIEASLLDEGYKIIAKICFEDDEINEKLKAYSYGIMISIPFLIATFIIYAVIPELRNLHGKCFMGYVGGLTVAYTFLATEQSQPAFLRENNGFCITIAFIMYIAFMSSFFWLNVMCFYIWWQFSHMRAPRGGRRLSERRHFILFSLYAWGSSFVLACICAIMQFVPDIPKHHILPNIGNNWKCWFPHRTAEFVYFYIPMIILNVCNVALFLATALKIRSIKQETAVLQTGDSQKHQYEKNKQTFYLYLKLFLIMGINWIAEWVSFVVDEDSWFFVLTDMWNILQGVFIFILFICQKKVKNLVIKRYRHLRYGSRTTDSSQYRSGYTASSTVRSTTKSSVSSVNENPINLTDMKSTTNN